MRYRLVVFAFIVSANLFLNGSATAEEGIAVPYAEFKALLAERIAREIRAERGDAEEAVPFRCSFDDAAYRFTLTEGYSAGNLRLSGRVISGRPEPVPLLGGDVAIQGMDQVNGCSLISGQGDAGAVMLLPEEAGAFEVEIAFLVPVRSDARSAFLSLDIPHALRNALVLETESGLRVIDAPGLTTDGRTFRFAARPAITVRFAPADAAAEAAPDIDLLTRISVENGRLVLRHALLPRRAAPRTVLLDLGSAQQVTWTSCEAGRIATRGSQSIAISWPAADGVPLEIHTIGSPLPEDGTVSVGLPRIPDNTGSQGLFALLPPEEGHLAIAAETGAPPSRVERIDPRLVSSTRIGAVYRHSGDGPLTLSFTPYQRLDAPAAVLDEIAFFVAVDESGTQLTTLTFTLPESFGNRLRIQAVPAARIWSVRVNGASRNAYADKEGDWLIPLASDGASAVQLAFIREGGKLGLHGRGRITLPAVGMPARKTVVGIALPERVVLTSLEGPVSPDPATPANVPPGFTGRPCFFSRLFFDGTAMEMRFSYKEPVDTAGAHGSAGRTQDKSERNAS